MFNEVPGISAHMPHALAVLGAGGSVTLPPNGGVANQLLEGKDPDRVAIRSAQGSWTFGDLDSASLRLAALLLTSGIQKGDRVLLIADNSFFWVASYLGILRAGLVCVPLPPANSGEEVAFVADSTDAAFAFVDARVLVRNARDLPKNCVTSQVVPVPSLPGRNVIDFEQILCSEPALVEFPRIGILDLAALMFTSGSTRRPRGVMVTHGNIVANTRSIIECLKLTELDSILTVLPFHYCFGTSLLHTHLMVGGQLVLDNHFMYPEAFLQHLQSSRCTGFAGVPSHYQILLRRSNIHNFKFPDLRYVQQAGGHMAPAFIRELREALPGTQVFVMYGQTEATARLSFVPPEMLHQKIGSIGKAIPGVTLSVVDTQGERVGVDEMGEIVAEGPNIAVGYWGEPKDSAHVFRGGKLYTGDIGTVDEDGFLYIVDRAGDFVKIGGKRTSCRDIEERILEFRGALEVAVIGVPDDLSGEAVRAYVVPRDPKDDAFVETLRAFCMERLPHPYVPKEFLQLSGLPKNSAGKVMKARLKELDLLGMAKV
jgi:acyl-CoA synthetase (AMP-forming)/AMP-acid ligase II